MSAALLDMGELLITCFCKIDFLIVKSIGFWLQNYTTKLPKSYTLLLQLEFLTFNPYINPWHCLESQLLTILRINM